MAVPAYIQSGLRLDSRRWWWSLEALLKPSSTFCYYINWSMEVFHWILLLASAWFSEKSRIKYRVWSFLILWVMSCYMSDIWDYIRNASEVSPVSGKECWPFMPGISCPFLSLFFISPYHLGFSSAVLLRPLLWLSFSVNLTQHLPVPETSQGTGEWEKGWTSWKEGMRRSSVGNATPLKPPTRW